MTYTLKVTNTGTATDSFDAIASGNNWATSAVSIIQLPKNTSGNLFVTVIIPANETRGATDRAEITVTSRGKTGGTTPASSQKVTLTTTAEGRPGVTLTPSTDAKRGIPGSTVSYAVAVKNTGPDTDTFDVIQSGNTWTTGAPATVSQLSANTSTTLVVTVNIPANAAGKTTDSAVIRVTSRRNTTVFATATLNTTVQKLGTGRWNARTSSTSQGKVLLTDGDKISFFNGTGLITVQAGDTNGDGQSDLGDVMDFVFALGTGASSGQLVTYSEEALHTLRPGLILQLEAEDSSSSSSFLVIVRDKTVRVRSDSRAGWRAVVRCCSETAQRLDNNWTFGPPPDFRVDVELNLTASGNEIEITC